MLDQLLRDLVERIVKRTSVIAGRAPRVVLALPGNDTGRCIGEPHVETLGATFSLVYVNITNVSLCNVFEEERLAPGGVCRDGYSDRDLLGLPTDSSSGIDFFTGLFAQGVFPGSRGAQRMD